MAKFTPHTPNEIKEMLAKQYSNIVTLEDYFNVKNQFGTLQLTKTVSLNVDRLIAQKDIDSKQIAA